MFRQAYQVPLRDRIKDPFKFPWWFRPDKMFIAYDGIPDAVEMHQSDGVILTLVLYFQYYPKTQSVSLFEGENKVINYHHNSALFLKDWVWSGCKFGFSSEAYEP